MMAVKQPQATCCPVNLNTMPRRKVGSGSKSPQKLTQTTLSDLLSSTSPAKSVTGSRTIRTIATRPRPQFRTPSGSEDDTSNSVGAIRFEKHVIDASDNEQPRLSPMKKRRTRQASPDSLELELLPVPTTAHAGSDNELDTQVYWKGKKKGPQNVLIDSDDSGRQNKPRLVRGVRPPSPEDEDDILDDEDREQFLYILFIISVRLEVLEHRMRKRNRKTAFQKNLERLRSMHPYTRSVNSH